MAGSMADNWRKIGSTSADDMAMKICYSVIVQNWTMAVSRPWSEWQQFAPGAFFCPFLRKEDPIWHKVVRNCGTMKSRGVIRPALFQSIRRGESVVVTDPKSGATRS